MANGQGRKKTRLATVILALLVAGLAAWWLWPRPVAESAVTESPANRPAVTDAAREFEQAVDETQQPGATDTTSDALTNACPTPLTAAEIDERNAMLRAEIERSVDLLANVDNPEYRLAAAMLLDSDEAPRALAMLQQAVVQDPSNKLIASVAMQLCLGSRAPGCEGDSLEALALQSDPENGATWLQIGMRRLMRNDETGAVEAFRHAIATPQFDSYYYEQISLLDRSWAGTTNLSLADRIGAALGVVAAMPIPVNVLFDHCRASVSGSWPELCEQLGRRMAADGTDMMTQMLGTTLQKVALESIDDAEGIARVAREEQVFQEAMGDWDELEAVYNMLLNDPGVLQNYLEDFDSYGEVTALKRAQQEYERLAASPDYDPCNFASNPYGR